MNKSIVNSFSSLVSKVAQNVKKPDLLVDNFGRKHTYLR